MTLPWKRAMNLISLSRRLFCNDPKQSHLLQTKPREPMAIDKLASSMNKSDQQTT